MDGVIPLGTHGRRILELDECNMDYNVKTNANKTRGVTSTNNSGRLLADKN